MASKLLGSKLYEAYGLTVIPRDIFSRNYYHYKSGEHVVFGGPSGLGKTELAFDLLGHAATPERPAYVAVSKPDDEVTAKYGKRYNFRFVQDWPVERKINEFWNGKPKGYIIWPKFGNINTDFSNAAAITARLMADRYAANARGNKKHSDGILVMDDTMVKAKIMGLDNQMVTILAMAKAMKLGLWVFVQKPTDSGRTPLWAYENASHFFFAKGGDQRMLYRYMQVGNTGEHAATIVEVLPKLEDFQFLYMSGKFICIVDKD